MKKTIFFTIIFAGLAFFMANGYDRVIENANSKTSVIKETAATGDALIGGAFKLTNQRGEKITDQDFKGKFMLVFFGFTNCPDVCPTDLMVMSNAMEKLSEKATEVVPIFITVDYENDTVEKMADYMKSFHPSMHGLTGTNEQLQEARKAYRVFAKKIEMDSLMGTMFNHSAYTYLMDREGKYVTHFPHDSKPEDIVAEIKKHL